MENNENIFKRFLNIRGMKKVLMVTLGLVVLCMAFSFINPTFHSNRNISNLLR